MAKQFKLKFKPTPLSRLAKYVVPIPMVGDPKWNQNGKIKDAWASREKLVYAHMLANKPGPSEGKFRIDGDYAKIMSEKDIYEALS